MKDRSLSDLLLNAAIDFGIDMLRELRKVETKKRKRSQRRPSAPKKKLSSGRAS